MPNNLLQCVVEKYLAQGPPYEEFGHYLECELTGFNACSGMHPLIMS